MRADQFIGLNTWAEKLLASQPKYTKVIHGRLTIFDENQGLLSSEPYRYEETLPSYKTEIISSIDGAWNDNLFDLHRYTLVDGRIFVEYIQAIPWSSGPMYFLALTQEWDGTSEVVQESLWTDEEMESH